MFKAPRSSPGGSWVICGANAAAPVDDPVLKGLEFFGEDMTRLLGRLFEDDADNPACCCWGDRAKLVE